mmetsp:Transcript_10127/g.19881  ORF Transcript_10127/g.19881 Transcript_10127/m.19881 type:complete len:209 (-) Transcript_10127:130-756(-)
MAGIDSYLAEAEHAMEEANKLYSTLGWNVLESEGNFTISTIPTDVSLNALKVEYFFDKNPVAVGRYVFDHYVELSNLENDIFDFFREVARFGPDAFGVFFRAKGVALIKAREIPLFVCYLQLSENTSAIVLKSVDLPGIDYSPDAVKASIDYDLYLFEPVGGDPNKTHLIHVARLDPKGSIPGSIVNTKLRNRGFQIKNFIDTAVARI